MSEEAREELPASDEEEEEAVEEELEAVTARAEEEGDDSGSVQAERGEPTVSIFALFFADFLFFIMIQRGRNSTFQFEAYYFH